MANNIPDETLKNVCKMYVKQVKVLIVAGIYYVDKMVLNVESLQN